jgi:DMSO/TMAO reductase YedYZ molybdopterin-dependent catalytic subunit
VILAALALIAGLMGILSWLNVSGKSLESGSVSIVQDGRVLREYTMDELAAMPYIEVWKTIASSSHANGEGLFRGVPLRALLNEVDENLLKNATQIVSQAEDAFVSAYSKDEVAESDSVFIAYSKDGKGLGSLKDGGSGPFRIIIQGDEFGNRSTKYLVRIEVK